MRKAFRNLRFLLLFSLILGCDKGNEPDDNLVDPKLVLADIELEYSITCGWGSRADTLIINQDSVHFVQNLRWGNSMDTIIDTSFVSPKTWLSLLYDGLNTNAFQQINLNSGGLPYDGCDVFLYIKKNQQSHAIRYEPSDTLVGMQSFIRQLDSLWNQIGMVPPSTN
jgi:hypothetical protein